MIVIHIDSQKDTAFLKECYKGIDNLILLYNPKRSEVDDALKAQPTEDVMMLGHGSPSGLFSHDWRDNIINYSNAYLLRGRNCIGIWCYAKRFAQQYRLKGYFTDMFISNKGEAEAHRYKATEEEVFSEVEFFAKAVNTLIKENVPYDKWVGKLRSIADMSKGFVKFNYDGMEYFDGTQNPKVNEDENPYGTLFGGTWERDYNEDLEVCKDEEVNDWFEDYCYEHGIEGDWAREITYPIFVAGWNSCRNAEKM